MKRQPASSGFASIPQFRQDIRGSQVIANVLLIAAAAILILGLKQVAGRLAERSMHRAQAVVDGGDADYPPPSIETGADGDLGPGSNSGAGNDPSSDHDGGEATPIDTSGLVQSILAKMGDAKSNERLAKLADALLRADYEFKGWQATLREAEQAYRYNLLNPALSQAEQDAIVARFLQASREVSRTQDKVRGLIDQAALHKGFMNAVGTTVSGIFALDNLMQADRQRERLIREGKYEEAWRHSLGAATQYVADSVSGVINKIAGLAGIAIDVGVSEGANELGRVIADWSFGQINDVAHWLYDNGWVNRKPRFEKGYDPWRK